MLCVLQEAPTFFPTVEEFEQPLKYIASIRKSGMFASTGRNALPSHPSWRSHVSTRSGTVWHL